MASHQSSYETSYKPYRAPTANDQALVDPPWQSLLSRLSGPREPAAPIAFAGVDLTQLRQNARRGLVRAALDYTGQYAAVDRGVLDRFDADTPLIVSGHQPELFHPGVWFKNFALDSLAKESGGVGVHLLIDSDICRETSIRVPTGSIASPGVVSVAYDEPRVSMPHEERRLHDDATFTAFPERVVEAIRPRINQPLVEQLWRHAEEARREGVTLGGVLSELRHRLEIAWGSETLELPVSRVVDSESFQHFAAELLFRGEEVARAYNGALAEYRAAHHLRNAAQPLPDLEADGDRWETPFWVWSEEDLQRRPLYAHKANGQLTLSDRTGWTAEGPDAAGAIADWLGQLRSSGVKIRSRALVTTLYGRLVLADLFLHGIGGAKYDQVTDRFAERLFGQAPPPHATLTATLRLPIAHDLPTDEDRRAAKQRLRDLRHHPERFLPDHPAAADKKRWIETEKTPNNAAERHAGLVEANETLREKLADLRNQAERRLSAAEAGAKAAAILDSREYSFCLFPADNLRRRLTGLAKLEPKGES